MTSKATFNYYVPKPLKDTYSYFYDFEKFADIHPFMISVEKISDNTFSIQESVNLFGIIPIQPVYEATVIELQEGKQIEYISTVKKGVELQIVISFSENPEKTATSITETVTIKANQIIARIFIKLIEKAHKKAIENLINKEKD